MALSCLPEPSVLKVENAVSIKYMQMTVDALQRFGFSLLTNMRLVILKFIQND